VNAYLFGSLVLLGVWGIVLVVLGAPRWRRERREFWWGSAVCSLLGFSEPLYVPEYWSVLSFHRWDLDGSARWGLTIAQPRITAFAPDAQLYAILGGEVYRDGRLPASVEDWSYVAWSPTRRRTFQVTVLFDGSTTTSTQD
jgi:hypothetical protein